MNDHLFILINPPTDLSISKDKAGNVGCIDRAWDQKHLTPPLDILYTAAVLEQAGHKVEIQDYLPNDWRLTDFVTYLSEKKEAPLLIGVRLSLPTMSEDILFVNTLKKEFSKIKLFVFGNAIKTTIDSLIKELKADYILFGDPEKIVKGLIRLEDSKNGLIDLKNIDGKEVSDKEWVYEGDLESLPFPAWHLIPIEKYLFDGQSKEDFLFYTLTSRGCPGACLMCPYYIYQGHKWRSRSAKNVVEELKYIHEKFGARSIQMRDPNYTLNKKRLKEICNLIIEEALDLDLRIETDLESLDKNLLTLMKNAGLKRIMTGIESPDSALLAEIGQKVNPLDKILENIKFCHEMGIRVLVFYMFGFPSQKWEHVMGIVELNKQIKADTSTTILTPYPGTKYYEEVKEQNLLVKEPDYKDLTGKECIIRTKYLSAADIILARRFCQRMFFLQKKKRMLKGAVFPEKIIEYLKYVGSYIKSTFLFVTVYKKYLFEKIGISNE